MYKLGVVSYLNALPLYRPLETREEVEIIRAVPAQLSGILARGECDAALIPIVDFLRGTGEHIISDACIGTKTLGDGSVRSVLLFHRAPLESIQSVAVDTSSHSSVALTRIILADAYKVLPPFVEAAPNLAQMLRQHEAALLIGDAALEAKAAVEVSLDNPRNHILDLGAAWKDLTGLPFVFAAWVARRGLGENARSALEGVLGAARDEGLCDLPRIIAEKPIVTGLSDSVIESYLSEAIEFHFSDLHRKGVEEFRTRCEKYGLI